MTNNITTNTLNRTESVLDGSSTLLDNALQAKSANDAVHARTSDTPVSVEAEPTEPKHSPARRALPEDESSAPEDHEGAKHDTGPSILNRQRTANEKESTSAKPTHIDRILAACQPHIIELWHDSEINPCVTIKRNNHHEHYDLSKSDIRDFFERVYYRSQRSVASTAAWDQVLTLLRAAARFDGSLYPVSRRIGHANGNIYVDLCDTDWRVIEITPNGFGIAASCPIRFLRRKSMQALPMPLPCTNAKALEQSLPSALGVSNENRHMLTLIVSWLLGVLSPAGEYPLLIISGLEGSGKSTLAERVQHFLDPTSATRQRMPDRDDDLILAAYNSFVLFFDNESRITNKRSDLLCQISTGGSFRKRKLYSNQDESVISLARPVIITGITQLVELPDLARRVLTLAVPKLDQSKQRDPQEMRRQFEKLHPALLGALFYAASVGLKHYKATSDDSKFKMMGLSRWVKAAESALPFSSKDFEEAGQQQQQSFVSGFIESNAVAQAIVAFMASYTQPVWEGCAGELLSSLVAQGLVSMHQRPFNNAKGFSDELRRISATLGQVGIELKVTRGKLHSKRRCQLYTLTQKP